MPTSPWYRAGTPLAVDLHVVGPPAWRSAPFAITVIIVLVIIAWSRRRPKPAVTEQPQRERAVQPKISVRAPVSPGKQEIAGQVIDAHTRQPIADAHVEIVRASFQGSERLASIVSDREGRFACAWPGGRDPIVVRVEGRWHAPMEAKLSGPADLDIELITRRRALLGALVDFSHRAGIRSPSGGEPTPADVKAQVGERPERVWCEATEAAAFGRAEVDHRTQSEVEALRPQRNEVPVRPGAD